MRRTGAGRPKASQKMSSPVFSGLDGSREECTHAARPYFGLVKISNEAPGP